MSLLGGGFPGSRSGRKASRPGRRRGFACCRVDVRPRLRVDAVVAPDDADLPSPELREEDAPIRHCGEPGRVVRVCNLHGRTQAASPAAAAATETRHDLGRPSGDRRRLRRLGRRGIRGRRRRRGRGRLALSRRRGRRRLRRAGLRRARPGAAASLPGGLRGRRREPPPASSSASRRTRARLACRSPSASRGGARRAGSGCRRRGSLC